MPIDAHKTFMSAFEDEFDDLAELGTRPATHLIDGAASLTPRVEVLPASGHTDGDVIVLAADADVCFPGDLCFFGVTLAFQGDPAKWADMLEAVVDLADTIVPGHGPVGGEREVRELQAYLRACVDAKGDLERSRPARGTPGSSATATPSTSNAPRARRGPRRDAPEHAEGHRLRRAQLLAEERDAPPRGVGVLFVEDVGAVVVRERVGAG